MDNAQNLNILFIHYDLPAQFDHLIRYFGTQTTHKVYAICQANAPLTQHKNSRVTLYTYQPEPANSGTHRYALDLERCAIKGQAIVNILQTCKRQGIHFDLAVAHTGWGETLYFKDIYPDTPLLGYVEFYYHAQGADAGFEPADVISTDEALRIRTLNAQLLLGMSSCDALVTPTAWQKSLFPAIWQPHINVIHEGVDIDKVKPDPAIRFTLPTGVTLTRDDEVVTYCARNLEPYRGFPTLLKAVELICQRRPHCHVIITGGDDVSYSKRLPDGQNYRQLLLKTVNLPQDRVHFLGSVPYATHLQILQLSSAHIYLTYPFVLSWSFMEALASGCVVIASDTSPVMDVLQPDINGLTVNFFDYQHIADRVDQVFAHPQRMRHLGETARQTIVQYYQHRFSIRRYTRLFQQLLAPAAESHYA